MLSTTFRATALALTLGALAACSSDPLNTAGRRDGAPGNPPSTATQRAVDSVTGDRTPADGRPGNPTGTAAERAFDRAAGTDVSGAYPRQDDCSPGNPPGTQVSRALGTTDPSTCPTPAERRRNRR